MHWENPDSTCGNHYSRKKDEYYKSDKSIIIEIIFKTNNSLLIDASAPYTEAFQRSYGSAVHSMFSSCDYRKWIMYYLDFRVKYPPLDSRSKRPGRQFEKAAATVTENSFHQPDFLHH